MRQRAQQDVLDQVEALVRRPQAKAARQAQRQAGDVAVGRLAQHIARHASVMANARQITQEGLFVTHQHGHRRIGTGEAAVGQQQGVVGKLLAKARQQVVQQAVAAQQAGRRRGWLEATGLGTTGQGAGPGVFGDGLQALGKAGRVAHPQIRQAQRAVVVRHWLRKIRVVAGVVERKQAPRLAELGKLVGQHLVKKLQIGLALAGLGMALGGQAVGQASGAKAPSLRKVIQHRVVAADLPVAPGGCRQIALLVDPRTLGGCQGHALAVTAQGFGRNDRLVNPCSALVQPDA